MIALPGTATPASQTSELFAIGVCTFRRPSLIRTLRSLSSQTIRTRMRFCVIVADNDDTASATEIIAEALRALPISLHYVHAPARNISVARNALLDKATELGASYLAMIDDDEMADADWAATLLAKMADPSLAVVLGRVVAVYRKEAPNWLRQAALHDIKPVVQPGGRILTGYTGNVLLRLGHAAIRSRRFDLRLGQTGGEDDAFFHAVVEAGGMIGYAPDAIVREDVPENREKLGFLLRRNFRSGQTYAIINAPAGSRRMIYFAKAALKATILTLAAGVLSFSSGKRTKAMMRASLHLGVCSELLGGRTLRLYGN
ncbi:MAG: glycosyltransferase [Loktanella sp.]|nr:glycosyltransferase [Loktanella sp.]